MPRQLDSIEYNVDCVLLCNALPSPSILATYKGFVLLGPLAARGFATTVSNKLPSHSNR